MTTREPVLDFDHHSPEFAADPFGSLDRARERCPVGWTQAHDGYWIVSGYTPVREILRDPARFPSGRTPSGQGSMTVPGNEGVLPFVPIETDGDEWRFWRSIFNPVLSPAAITRLQPTITKWSEHYVDLIAERGHADFIDDLASPVPAAITIDWLGLPVELAPRLAQISHNFVATTPDSPEFQEALRGHEWVYGVIGDAMRDRRAAPREDIMSYVVSRQHPDGQPLTDDEVMSVVQAMIEAGVDTTTTLIGHALRHLGDHPEQRRTLVDDPEAMTLATEEFLRYYSPVIALGRRAAEDSEWEGGAHIHAGDRVLLSYAAANRDPAQFEDAGEFNLARFPNRHCAFGLGIHRCVGSHLARATFKTVLRTVLERIPDYEVVPEGVRHYPDAGLLSGLQSLPVTFPPRPRKGSAR